MNNSSALVEVNSRRDLEPPYADMNDNACTIDWPGPGFIPLHTPQIQLQRLCESYHRYPELEDETYKGRAMVVHQPMIYFIDN